MSEDEIKDADMNLVRTHVEALGEHFDSVQIFCTRHSPGDMDGTVHLNLGSGNYFTRSGHVREWLIQQDEQARIHRRNNQDE